MNQRRELLSPNGIHQLDVLSEPDVLLAFQKRESTLQYLLRDVDYVLPEGVPFLQDFFQMDKDLLIAAASQHQGIRPGLANNALREVRTRVIRDMVGPEFQNRRIDNVLPRLFAIQQQLEQTKQTGGDPRPFLYQHADDIIRETGIARYQRSLTSGLAPNGSLNGAAARFFGFKAGRIGEISGGLAIPLKETETMRGHTEFDAVANGITGEALAYLVAQSGSQEVADEIDKVIRAGTNGTYYMEAPCLPNCGDGHLILRTWGGNDVSAVGLDMHERTSIAALLYSYIVGNTDLSILLPEFSADAYRGISNTRHFENSFEPMIVTELPLQEREAAC